MMRCITVLFAIAAIHAAALGKGKPFPRKDTLSILSAKNANLVRVAIRGAYNPHRSQPNLISSHYGECIEMRIENITDSLLHLVLPCGTMLLSLDSSAQNMLVSETKYFILAPRQRKYERVKAFCAELSKNSPDVYVSYEVGPLASEPLLRLALVIQANGAQNRVGQCAVWAVTDKATTNELGDHYTLLREAQKLLDQAGIPFDIFTGQERITAKAEVEPADKAKAITPKTNSTAKRSNVTPRQPTTINPAPIDRDTVSALALNKPVEETKNAAEAEVEVLVQTNDEKVKPTEQQNSSEWIVYIIGIAMLGLGIYVLSKKATHSNLS
ncbi:MAG: hypothetical protein RMJ44_09535 [Cytophagales bacterium]|nr:hypothetical protein [Bernardetiaceae bacterium]MDW8211316.1 hypothetical protein [Cytophagales bacterium]